ncbi:oxidoreductase [Streptomyces sp. 3MP-14]|uniref:Oxidoreductase n=1 Tax=Streptomyces mimosae TaxID=2586635 RepID=A0A5N5ZZW5_9ACTN|nr:MULTISPECIES: FMN reductase [Streptomyces]KAB8162021.1 oxidoreductase [Streptomyces mimosae]KAB8173719.1 oxidoreductase [Streptomyces sp. 3MP-14]
MTPRTLVVVSAGLSQPSSTRLLADRLAEATRRHLDPGEEGRDGGPEVVTIRVVELRDLARDIADHLVTGFPAPPLREAIEAVERADAVIAVTPVFAASYSGLFKSFFDLFEPTALVGTPVLMAATGGTARHSLTLEHAMRPLFAYLRATVAPTAVFAAAEDWGGDGDPLTDTLPTRIDRAARELATLLLAEAGVGAVTGAAADGGAAAGGLAPAGGGEPAGGDAEEGTAGAPGLAFTPFAEQLAALRRR